MIRRYSELILLPTFDERFDYLKLAGVVGRASFGYERYLNQNFYQSDAWKSIRQQVILRDNGCDLGIPGMEIFSGVVIHHLNPVTVEDVSHGHSCVLDLDNLITTCAVTHNAIHYGDKSKLHKTPIERKKGDTIPWIVS